jgi:hypothetical protein
MAGVVSRMMIAGAIVNAILVVIGWIVFPTTVQARRSWLGLAADCCILATYGVIGWKATAPTDRYDSRILSAAILLTAAQFAQLSLV